MKPIKVNPENRATIENALSEVNGKASQHAYTDFSEIENLVKKGESRLDSLGVPKKERAGAWILATSGGAVSRAYGRKGFSRVATFVRIERKSTGWFIVKIEKETIGQSGGSVCVYLTKDQKEKAVSRFSSSIPEVYMG